MKGSFDKSIYLKFWQAINPSNQQYINTSKTIEWIQALMKSEQEVKINKTQRKKPALEKQEQQKNSLKKLSNNHSTKSENKKSVQEKNIASQALDILKKQNNSISEEIILSYINKYTKTDQYQLFQMEKIQIYQKMQIQSSNKKQDKSQNKKYSKKPSSKPQPQYNKQLITLSYEQAIFFFCWFKQNFQISQKSIIQQLNQEQNLQPQSQQTSTQQIKNPQNIFNKRYFMQLSQTQIQNLNQQSFNSLKQHQPKLHIIFKHYVKISHIITKNTLTFDQRHMIEEMMTLHQWMLFCKEWKILNAKSINENWTLGKVTKEFLLIAYYKNSLFRKQMSFQLFQRAIIMISFRMFKDCDINNTKPIDMMLNFLFIKNELRFLQNLKIKNINYSQCDILNCFKQKNREVYQKLNIVKITDQSQMKSSILALLRNKKFDNQKIKTDQALSEEEIKQNYSNPMENTILKKNRSDQFEGFARDSNGSQSGRMLNFSKTGLANEQSNKKVNSNRKSAPEIGIHLPKIENNQYFSKIPQNYHLNKFKEYIQNQIPTSSSVYRNKITGYHTIHTLRSQQEEDKLIKNDKHQHQRINSIIGAKLSNILETDRFNNKTKLTKPKQDIHTKLNKNQSLNIDLFSVKNPEKI